MKLSTTLYEELGTSIEGDVYLPNDPNFLDYSKMFNGNIRSSAQAVTCPKNTEDVSKIVLFCAKYSFSPSIKAGGYGTAGWAVNGDIIIDLSRFVDLDIETPQDGGFTSLRDMVNAGCKGKKSAGVPLIDSFAANSGKRRRENDALLRNYDAASLAVASFLQGPPLLADGVDSPRPLARRRLHIATHFHQVSDEEYQNTFNMTTATASVPPFLAAERAQMSMTSGTSPFGHIGGGTQSSMVSSTSSWTPGITSDTKIPPAFNNSPFGYISGGPSNAPPSPTGQSVLPSPFSCWGEEKHTHFTNPSLPSASQALLAHAEPIHPLAYVTFGAGVRQKEIDRYTAEHPLEGTSMSGMTSAIPYHVPFSAHPVGSSIMLLGGFGFLSRLHGLSIDNLIEVEMVLSDGRIIYVNENDHPDLWWALRGAGPAFGVATRYKARAFPVPVVFAGNLIYRFHRATAPSLIKHFRDCVKGAPRELYANVLLTAGPADHDSLVVIQMCYVGPKDKGQEYLQAISSWDGERCLLNEVDEKSFLHQQDSVAQVLRGKAGRQWFIRSTLINSLPDDIVNQTVIQFADTPVGCTWLFELAGGTVADFEDTPIPKTQREALFTIAALHQWDMGVDDPRCISSAEKWIAETLTPVNTGAPFPSFLGRQEPAARTMQCFGDNWSRLIEIKKKYDPKGLFRNNLWPLDAEGNVMEPSLHEPPSP